MFGGSCSYSYIEQNKIEFAFFFGFFYDFILNLQGTAKTHKGSRIYMHSGPWNF
jgi:hypothetical protein